MSNTRFATAIHILTLLAAEPDEWMSSEFIAGSININPAMVRKELVVLNAGNLVVSKKGKEGGVKLNKPARDILISDVFRLVNNADLLGKKNLNTNPKCPIGRQINEKLGKMFFENDQIVINNLSNQNLEQFLKQFN